MTRHLQALLVLTPRKRRHTIPYAVTNQEFRTTKCPKCGRPVESNRRGGWRHTK